MLSRIKITDINKGLSDDEIKKALEYSVLSKTLKKVLIVPPDSTRAHSGAGIITNIYYHALKDSCEVDILPALGTHVAMSESECKKMYGDIPFDRFIAHNWRTDVVKVGEAPSSLVEELSEGMMREPISFQINRRLLDKSYDLIISVGQVVPHEVAGMANYTKNIFVGCGGSGMINASHYLGAVYGMERMMGRDFSPVRKLFDYGQERFLSDLPLDYVLTVTTEQVNDISIHGLFAGGGREYFEDAVRLSQQKNLIVTGKPLKKALVFLNEEEFKSTWLGNKAIYRTRMAIADGGELVIIAPGVERFGEDPEIDRLIRKYGYFSREAAIRACDQNDELKTNLSAAAHLIHGTSDGRFRITYCPGRLSEQEITGVGFGYMPIEKALKKYMPERLKEGMNNAGGEEIYYISNPALGLWTHSKIL